MIRRSSYIYAAGHFLVDFSCALIMLSLPIVPWMFFIYNFCAFALQMPIGLMADYIGHNRRFALLGVILVLVAFLPIWPELQVILAGIGNACYHVGGGRDSLLGRRGLTELGLFVSPGAVGIFLGSRLSGNVLVTGAAALLLVLCGVMIFLHCSGKKIVLPKGRLQPRLACLMLLVVILRSMVGMCMDNTWKIGVYIACGAIAGAAGKFLGGVFADRFGYQTTGVATLILSAVLFCLPNNGIAGVLGCLLFNMTMPVTLGRAADASPGYEGFSFGLLTFGLFLGYVPSFLGLFLPSYIGACLALLSALLLALDPGG